MAPTSTKTTTINTTDTINKTLLDQFINEIVLSLYRTQIGSHNDDAFTFPRFEQQGSDPTTVASHWSLYFKSGGLYFRAPSNGSIYTFAVTGPQFRATSSGTQVIATSTNTKLTILTVEGLDTNGDYDNVACRFTPDTAGWYMIFGNVGWLSSVADKIYQARIYKNGSAVSGAGADFTPSLSGAGFYFTTMTLLQANGSSDYFEFFVSHMVGANATVSEAIFWGYKVA